MSAHDTVPCKIVKVNDAPKLPASAPEVSVTVSDSDTSIMAAKTAATAAEASATVEAPKVCMYVCMYLCMYCACMQQLHIQISKAHYNALFDEPLKQNFLCATNNFGYTHKMHKQNQSKQLITM